MSNIQPKDPSRSHFYISLVKSAIRIIACAACAVLTSDTNVIIMASGLIVAELLGVAEEL